MFCVKTDGGRYNRPWMKRWSVHHDFHGDTHRWRWRETVRSHDKYFLLSLRRLTSKTRDTFKQLERNIVFLFLRFDGNVRVCCRIILISRVAKESMIVDSDS